MTLELERLGATLGVEVCNFDTLAAHSEETWVALRQAVAEHCLVVFRNQVLSAHQLVDFAAGFGAVMDHFAAYEHLAPGTRKAYMNSSQPGSLRYSGHDWHTDYSHLTKPPFYSCLYFTRTPSLGGDTGFSNQYEAYNALSERWKTLLEGLESIHDATPRYVRLYREADLEVTEELKSGEAHKHPLVLVHPDSGRKALFVSEALSQSIVDMPRKESKVMLEFLFQHCASPEFGYRHVWRQYDLAIFDNRCTLHRAVSDYNLDDLRENMVVCMGGDWGEVGDPWVFEQGDA